MTVNTTGSAFFNVGYDFNAAPGSDGTITIDGGSYTNTYGDVAINFYGSANPNVTGSLTLTNSASLVMEPTSPGNGLGFDIGASFQDGYTATGTLLVQGGSSLEARNTAVVNPGNTSFTGGYNNINIGRGYGSAGYATVTGAGSRMTTEGGAARITIGRFDGYGVLNIEQGGFVGAFNLHVGRDGGIGHINVDGVGSELKTSTAYGHYNGTNYNGSAGYTAFGRSGGRAYLSVTNGGTINVENEYGVSDNVFFRLGRDNGSYGYALVQGEAPASMSPSTAILVRQIMDHSQYCTWVRQARVNLLSSKAVR